MTIPTNGFTGGVSSFQPVLRSNTVSNTTLISNSVRVENAEKPKEALSKLPTPAEAQQSLSIIPPSQVKEEVKSAFSDTKAFARKVGDVLGKINDEFSVSGGIASTFKDAVVDKNGKLDVSRAFRTTSEYSEKAQNAINEGVKDAIDSIDKFTESTFKSIDETFTPMKTFTDAVGKFSEAKKSGSTWETIKAGVGVAWGSIKAAGSAVANYGSKLVVGLGAFAASGAVAVGGIATKAVTAIVTPFAGAVEAVGRTVVAPVLRGAAEATGKVVVGAGALVGGAVGTVANALNIGDWAGKIKDSSVGKWFSEKLSTKSDIKMNEIDSMLSNAGISEDSVKDRASSNKSEKLKSQGFENGEMGIKDTAKKWFQIAFGQKDAGVMTVSGALSSGKFSSALANGGVSSSQAFSALGTAGQVSVGIGAVAGPLTTLGSGYKVYAGIQDHSAASSLKDRTVQFMLEADNKIEDLQGKIKDLEKNPNPENNLKIDEFKAKITELKELKTVAEFEGNRVGLGIKKLGITQNSILAASGVASTTATIATFVGASAVVAATGPVGLGLAATGALIAGGVATYKVYKAEKREARNDKLEAQQQLVEEKMKGLDPNSEQFKSLDNVKSKIVSMRMEKDPNFAADYLSSKVKQGSTEAQKLVKDVFGLSDESSKSPDLSTKLKDKLPVVSGDQRIFWRDPAPALA